jgi:hypothetical protein
MAREQSAEKVYVLQEGIYDDIAAVDELETIDTGDPSWLGAASAPGTVRSWCEAHGIALRPKEFVPGQVESSLILPQSAMRCAEVAVNVNRSRARFLER